MVLDAAMLITQHYKISALPYLLCLCFAECANVCIYVCWYLSCLPQTHPFLSNRLHIKEMDTGMSQLVYR